MHLKRKIILSFIGRYKFICLMNYLLRRKLLVNYKKSGNEYREKENHVMIIYIADGRIRHGGLSDRLRGIASSYSYCKKNGFDFRIYFSFPFILQDYLVPNTYNWIIEEKELIYKREHSTPIYITSTSNSGDEKVQEDFLSKTIRKIRKRKIFQLHLYTNMYFADKEYNILFSELFKPSDVLEKALTYHSKKINSKYIAIVFRFQQLLGDFDEGNYPTLDKKEQTELITKCKNVINKIHKENNDCPKILVTSDSSIFLKSLIEFDFIYIIPGKIYHVDYTFNEEKYVYLKSFLDMFLISRAEKVYFAHTDMMYQSGFAQRASMITNVPYSVYEF